MNLRQKRLADVIRTYASESILLYEQMQPHNFGIISVNRVEVSPDYSYADIYITAQENEKELPHFIAPTAHDIERHIGKEFSLRKTPHIRFKLPKEARKETNILELINTLDHQYGLSQMDS
jgi:ribosome-binding factor A